MISEYFEIKDGHILHHLLSRRPKNEEIKLQKKLVGLFAFNNCFFRTEVEAYRQIIRNLTKDIEHRKACIDTITEQRDNYQTRLENLEKTCDGQEKIIKEYWERISRPSTSKVTLASENESLKKEIEKLNATLKLVQGHAKRYFKESERLGNMYDEMQDAFHKSKAENAGLKNYKKENELLRTLNIAFQKEHAAAIERLEENTIELKLEIAINDGYDKQGIECGRKGGDRCNMKDVDCSCYCSKCETCSCMHVVGAEDYPEVTYNE